MFGSISQWDGDILNHFNRLEREMADLFGHSSGPASIRAVAHGSYPAINLGSRRALTRTSSSSLFSKTC